MAESDSISGWSTEVSFTDCPYSGGRYRYKISIITIVSPIITHLVKGNQSRIPYTISV